MVEKLNQNKKRKNSSVFTVENTGDCRAVGRGRGGRGGCVGINGDGWRFGW